MEVNDALILKLERLARLQLEPIDRARFATDLSKMLAMVDKLQSLDTTGVQPLVYMNEEVSAPVEDIVEAPLEQSLVFKNAPQHNGEYFLVPKVIGQPLPQPLPEGEGSHIVG
jgi:aspartyl-tRNA(Asn)/glutamyl-tRNA(Gln) amidotransferase subunit C